MAALQGAQPAQASWVTWHSQGDSELRSTIIRQVYSLFAKRKPVLHDQGKLPDFIKRLEEALYKTAKSREEYADQSTLEARLLEVVRRVMQKPNGHKPSNADQLLAALNQTASLATPDAYSAAQQQQHHQQQQLAHAGGGMSMPMMVPVGSMQQQQTAGSAFQLQQQPQQPLGVLQPHSQPLMMGTAGSNGLLVGGAAGMMQGQSMLSAATMVPQQAQQVLVPQPGGNPQSVLMSNGGGLMPKGQLQMGAAAGTSAGVGTVDVLQRAGGGGGAADAGTPGGSGVGGAANQPFSMLTGAFGGSAGAAAMMSNGAPVLLRGGGLGGGGGMVPMQTGLLNGMVPTQLGGSGMQLNNLLGSQPPLLLKQEGGAAAGAVGPSAAAGGMVPMSATGSGLAADAVAVAAQHQQQQFQQQQQQRQAAFGALGGLGLSNGGLGGNSGMMIPINGVEQSAQQGAMGAGLQPQGQLAAALQRQQAAQQQQHRPLLAQQQFLQQQQQHQHQQAAQQPHGQLGSISLGSFGDLGAVKAEPGGESGTEGQAPTLDALLTGSAAHLDFAQMGNNNGAGEVAGTNAAAAAQQQQQQQQQQQLHNEQQRKQQILKQQRWLLFLRHCAKCPAGVEGEAQCQYGTTCHVAKELWKHLINCKDQFCTYPRCQPSRMLLRHHQKCTSAQCPVCTPVKQYVSKQRAMMMSRKAAALPPEQRQAYLMRLQQVGASHPELMQLMEGGGGTVVGGASGASAATAAQPDPFAAMHPSLAAVMNNGGGNNILAEAQAAPKRQRTILQENMGTSLIEFFNQQQIRLHLEKLKAAPQPAKPSKVFTLEDLPNFEDENSCKVCGLNRLTFEPPSLYCFSCGQRIKRNQVFYCTPAGHEIKGSWCHTCYTDIKTDRLELDGFVVRKAELEKRKNDDEVEEGWVQCDRCEGWVHQICGLFNKGRNNEDAGYLCPHCLLHGLATGERKLPAERPQAMLSARDLPRCDLSDLLEARLERTLQEERLQRATALGVPVEQVPTAEGLTVRVVNNVVKKNEVKMRFFDAFKNDGYPEAFLYKQKVILLFQNIDGVDLCLYCLYMQEYGEEAPEPNRKMLYLSYLDSVKYFQPEDVQAAGRSFALRTLVYHDLLVGYLKYMKDRGFLAIYIWACPPLQGDDYILYCHPGKQKTPRSDRLRDWYHTMLRQAKAEGIVTYVSNLYDTYFEGGKDHRLDKPSITHVPYFEGDYWPGEAENLLANLGEEQRQAGKSSSKARSKGGSKGKRYGAGAGTADEQLLQRLGDVIQGMKDDFMVVHLQEPCSYCREYISGAPRHAHPNPPQKVVIKAERSFDGIVLDRPGGEASRTVALQRFQLCGGCLTREQGAAAGPGGTPLKPRGLPIGIDLRDLRPLPCAVIPPATDSVSQLENEIFDSRQAFLSLCQGNHYQFDTLRRAKHSSMMCLYHLHNPTAPAFSCTCNVCNQEIEPGQGFRCTVCSDFDMCATCKARGLVVHPHPLAQHVRKIDEQHQRLTEKERQERSTHLQRTMWLLVHASGCADPHCTSSNCAKVKGLFNHALSCPKKIAGGCPYCRRMWALLQAHAKTCTASDCPVPRCSQLRELRRHQAARQEEKRRAAYRAMLRAQAAATGGGSASGVLSAS
ncbi:hypothetical protein N2152v2_002574 [Parachlorella kessleri]